MDARETLSRARALMDERGAKYGTTEACFARISSLASIILGRTVTPREVAIVLTCVKLGRMPEAPDYFDNYDDAINYLAIAKEMLAQPVPEVVQEAHRVEIEEAIRALVTPNLGGNP